MSGHTPGPWVGLVNGVFVTDNPWSIDHEDGSDNTVAAIGDLAGNVVALVISDDDRPGKDRWDDSELEANAHLIAAAPDLLAALEKIMEDMDSEFGTDYNYENARTVIAKARGEQ